ncbi:ABC transporter permease [Nocardioides iriomotensis]|uniref:FtsX-like permease family protein n=1 Tax=Nocardioides iriomotensis TaxID=715784 RepID=A0A4V1Z277_9ACTN|nr:FtsX-like permease family protein [Nocardioides iriomotensis]RYU13446.1 FtsX-like permease family protein [Nocardioides iriomotensis]
MFKAAWKSLMGRKLRLLMSTFAIVLGVAFVAGSLIFTDTLSRSFDAIFASSVGDVVVRPTGTSADDGPATTRTVPASLVDDLAEVDGAARADGNVSSFSTFVVGENGKVIGGQGAPGIGANWSDAPAAHGLEGLAITEGHAPRNGDEVALDAGTAERAGFEIGDTVHLVTSSAEAVLRPTLVGIAEFADGGSTNGATITVFDTTTAQDLFVGGKDAFNDVWVTADEGVSQEELRDDVAAALPAGFEAVTGDTAADEAASELVEAISFLSTFLLIFAGIALVVGSFLIVNTFSILVAQRSRELALLRAIGASRRQVTRSVMFEAVVLGAVGSTIGLGLGVLLAMGIRALFATFGLDLSGQDLIIAARTPIAAYAVGILVTVVAAYIPARRSARIPPVAALRDDVAMPESALHWRLVAGAALIVGGGAAMVAGLVSDIPRPGWWVGGGILAVLLGVAAASPVISRPVVGLAAVLYRRIYGSVGTLAGQNALRNPRRTAATASALMIGLALVTTMSILGSSAKDSVDKTIEENFYGDLVVSNVIGVPFSTSIADKIEKTDGVASVSRLRYAIAQVDGDGQGVMGVDPTSLRAAANVPMVEGELTDLDDGKVLISDSRAEDENVGVGDTVTISFPNGKEDLEVAGIYTTDNNTVLFYPYTLTLSTLADAGFQAADNYLLIQTEPGADVAALQRTIEEQTAELPTVTVKDQQGFAEEQRAPIDQMLLLIYALLGLALVIAVLGIINTLALSVIERTREVGLLRAIGLGRSQLRRMIRLEAIAIAVLGAVLGVGMGLVFGLALMSSLADEGLEVITVPTLQLVGYVLAAGFVGVLAAVFPARRAARLDVLQAIATE